MASGVRAATLLQIGKETTRGTAVAATRKVIATSVTYRRLQEMEQFEGENTGLLARTVRAPLVVREGTEFEVSMRLGFEQILWPLLSGLRGAVAPTNPGTGEAKLWTFTPAVSADPAPDAYTAEFVESSFTDEAEMEAPYTVCTEIEVRGENSAGVPGMRASFVARKTQDSTKTGSIALPTLFHASNARWAVYFDPSWATLGATLVSGQVRNLVYRLTTGIRGSHFLDNRADLDFSFYEFGVRQADLTFEVTHDPAAAKFVQVEEALKTAGTLRFVRCQLNGPAFGAPDAGLSRFVRFDGAYAHAPDSMSERGRDVDGNLVVGVHLQSVYDPTQAQDIVVAVQNNLAAFP